MEIEFRYNGEMQDAEIIFEGEEEHELYMYLINQDDPEGLLKALLRDAMEQSKDE